MLQISCVFVFQIVNEMASAAGLPCDIDPALCAALRTQKSGERSYQCVW